MNSDNPYQSPRSDADAEDPAQPANVSVVRILLGFGAGMLAGMATWIGLLLVFFADSTEYWPGWACAVPAVVAAIVVYWLIAPLRFRSGR